MLGLTVEHSQIGYAGLGVGYTDWGYKKRVSEESILVNFDSTVKENRSVCKCSYVTEECTM